MCPHDQVAVALPGEPPWFAPADPATHDQDNHAPTHVPAPGCGLRKASDALADPSTGHPPHPAPSTTGTNAPPATHSPTTRPRSPCSSRRARSTRLPTTGAAPPRLRRRPNRHPVCIPHHTAIGPTWPPSDDRADITQSSPAAVPQGGAPHRATRNQGDCDRAQGHFGNSDLITADCSVVSLILAINRPFLTGSHIHALSNGCAFERQDVGAREECCSDEAADIPPALPRPAGPGTDRPRYRPRMGRATAGVRRRRPGSG